MKKIKIDEGILNAIKFCIYPCSQEDKVVLIPENELENGREELSVRYLISNYGFKIQSVIPGSVEKKEHFEPLLKDKRKVIEKGLRYRRIENGFIYQIMNDVDVDGFVTVRDVDAKTKDKQYFADDVLKLLKSGKFTVLKK